MNIVKTSLRLEEEKLKAYKKWLIDNGYRSINQHLNEVIDECISRSRESRKQKGKRNKR